MGLQLGPMVITEVEVLTAPTAPFLCGWGAVITGFSFLFENFYTLMVILIGVMDYASFFRIRCGSMLGLSVCVFLAQRYNSYHAETG